MAGRIPRTCRRSRDGTPPATWHRERCPSRLAEPRRIPGQRLRPPLAVSPSPPASSVSLRWPRDARAAAPARQPGGLTLTGSKRRRPSWRASCASDPSAASAPRRTSSSPQRRSGQLVIEPDVVVLTCEDGAIELECPNGIAPQTPQYAEYELDVVKRRDSTLAWRSPRRHPPDARSCRSRSQDPGESRRGRLRSRRARTFGRSRGSGRALLAAGRAVRGCAPRRKTPAKRRRPSYSRPVPSSGTLDPRVQRRVPREMRAQVFHLVGEHAPAFQEDVLGVGRRERHGDQLHLRLLGRA